MICLVPEGGFRRLLPSMGMCSSEPGLEFLGVLRVEDAHMVVWPERHEQGEVIRRFMAKNHGVGQLAHDSVGAAPCCVQDSGQIVRPSPWVTFP
jgi:hypothetical protein